MTGFFQDKKSGTWYLSRGSGKHRKKIPLGKNERLARLRHAEVEAEIERGKAGFPDTQESRHVAEVFARYLARVKINCAPRTHRRYEACADHWREYLDAFGLELVEALTPHQVELFKGWRLEQGAKACTVNKELVFLKSAFIYSTGSNPFRMVKPLSERDSKDVRFLTREEVALLLTAADEDFKPFLIGYLYTGARKMELTALTWEDIDWKRGRIRLTNLKTYKSHMGKYRYVPMHPRLKAVLEERKKESAPFIPPGSVNTLRRRLITTAKRAGLEKLTRLHDLRHTFASRLIQKGVSLYIVGKLLGHSDPSTTQRYAHIVPETYADAVGLLDF